MRSVISYRPDIDGLRAFAVLAVIFGHFKIPYFSGGYVGVDIFFVISGYLITGNIVRQLDSGSFSFTDFYERRTRRIQPAFLGMVLFFFFAPLLMPSIAHIEEFYKSILASTFFVSNIFFWKTGGYFDAPAAHKPLLHTWSLGIEEQFYIFMPFILYAIWRFARHKARLTLSIMALCSFALSCVMIFSTPNSVFFLLPTRAWELFCGSLLAIAPSWLDGSKNDQGIAYRHILGTLAAILLVTPVFYYDKHTLFPAFTALPPCLGAVLYIYLGQNDKKTWLHTILSTKYIVSVGLISYSLYLWHWPVWVFSNLYWTTGSQLDSSPAPGTVSASASSVNIALFCFIATLLLAYGSWKYIETPFRKRTLLGTRKSFVSTLAMTMVIVCSFSIYLQSKEHLSSLLSGFSAFKYSVGAVNHPTQFDVSKNGLALINKNPSFPVVFMAIGDSHMEHYSDMLSNFTQNTKLNGYYARSGMPFLSNSVPLHKDFQNINNDKYFNYAINNNIQHVLLSCRWIGRAGTMGYNPVQLTDEQRSNIENALKETLEKYTSNGIHVWLIMPTPSFPFDVPSSLQRVFNAGGDVTNVGLTWSEYLNSMAFWRYIFEKYKSEYVHIIDPSLYLCENGFCKTVERDTVLYHDAHHLTIFGEEFVKEAFIPFFEAVMTTAKSNPTDNKGASMAKVR